MIWYKIHVHTCDDDHDGENNGITKSVMKITDAVKPASDQQVYTAIHTYAFLLQRRYERGQVQIDEEVKKDAPTERVLVRVRVPVCVRVCVHPSAVARLPPMRC